ncbi:MAG: DUF6502 family protein [Woeseiaceae bacterium]|nr:DUF6502 family protein [Woeseiaceae bacterium]
MSDIDGRLSAALVAIFRPLASILVRAGVNVRPVIELLKRCFVDAAITEHGNGDKPASISKASRLTGLTRAEVRRLASEEDLAEMPGRVLGILESSVLSTWKTSPMFHDDSGNPAPLPLTGSDKSFEALVRYASGITDFDTALAALEERGSIRLTEDGMVHLETRQHIIRNDLPLLLASGLGTLASTVSKNWNRVNNARADGRQVTGMYDDPDRLEQVSAYANSIDASTLMSVRRMCNERILRFAREMDDFLMPLQVLPGQADESMDVTPTHRIGVGVYYFEIDAPE